MSALAWVIAADRVREARRGDGTTPLLPVVPREAAARRRDAKGAGR